LRLHPNISDPTKRLSLRLCCSFAFELQHFKRDIPSDSKEKNPEIIHKTICRSADQQNWFKELNSLTTDTLVREMLDYEVNHPCEFQTVTCSTNIWLEKLQEKL
jgi:hypothetical protein